MTDRQTDRLTQNHIQIGVITVSLLGCRQCSSSPSSWSFSLSWGDRFLFNCWFYFFPSLRFVHQRQFYWWIGLIGTQKSPPLSSTVTAIDNILGWALLAERNCRFLSVFNIRCCSALALTNDANNSLESCNNATVGNSDSEPLTQNQDSGLWRTEGRRWLSGLSFVVHPKTVIIVVMMMLIIGLAPMPLKSPPSATGVVVVATAVLVIICLSHRITGHLSLVQIPEIISKLMGLSHSPRTLDPPLNPHLSRR